MDRYFLTMVLMCAAVLITMVLIYSGRESQRQQRISICHPYLVLAHYKLKNKNYVVCGNDEHKGVEY